MNNTYPTWIHNRNVSIKIGTQNLKTIEYGNALSELGECFIAWTQNQILQLSLCPQKSDVDKAKAQLKKIQKNFPDSKLIENSRQAQIKIKNIFSSRQKNQIDILLNGTDFQLKVWKALINTKPGERLAYSDIAKKIGNPKAVRAVGSAVSKNPIALLVPCHRIVRKNGDIGNYYWGSAKKREILNWES